MTLTLNFQGQIWNLLYLSQKWSDCHGTKSKHIDWTPRPQIWPSGLTLAMTLTLDFQGQIWNLLYLWIFMVKFWNRCMSEWEGWLTLHKGCGSRSFMTMTVTIWWLRSGVWIYQIVTGVTSVVGVPSTHLVLTVIHYKLLGVCSAISSVMMVMSFTWIFVFAWICSVVLTDVLDKIILITVGFCMMELENCQVFIVNIEYILWMYFLDMPLLLKMLRNGDVWTPLISPCLKRVFFCHALTN